MLQQTDDLPHPPFSLLLLCATLFCFDWKRQHNSVYNNTAIHLSLLALCRTYIFIEDPSVRVCMHVCPYMHVYVHEHPLRQVAEYQDA